MKSLSRWIARHYLGKPDQAELIHIKVPQISDLRPAFMNEAAFRLKTRRSYQLTNLNVELTNRCNLSCDHCPGPGTSNKNRGDMDFETFKNIIDRCPHVKTLLPYQWGEPLLSPILFDCITYAKNRGIRVMLTTNGTLLSESICEKLIRSGLDRLTVSFEGDMETMAAIRGVDPNRIIKNAEQFKALCIQRGSPCQLDLSMVVDENTESKIDAFTELFRELADRVQLIPRFVSAKRTQPCRELWRGVLVVLSNGDVTLCCADQEGRAVVGNVKDKSPHELFNGPELRRIRALHRRREFPGVCELCSEYASQRVSPRFS